VKGRIPWPASQSLPPAEPTVVSGEAPESVRADQAGSAAAPSDDTQRISTFADLLEYAGSWAGDDFEECLAEVYAARGEAEF